MKKNLIIMLAAALPLCISCTKNKLQVNPTDTSGSNNKTFSSPVGDVVGKITVGYQGWFSAAGDGSPVNAWGHDNLEMWPDTREYATTYSGTPFSQGGVAQPGYTGNLGNGQPAKMFSSYDQSTVNTHFQWMQQYGIDCAALQRFANEITPGSSIKAQRDGMATKVKTAAQTYSRKFYIMYDVSGWGNLAVLKTDWTNTIAGSLNLLTSSAYAKQNGKPVVCIYGLGYASHPSSVTDALDLINWFKAQGCYVIGSVPGQWRTGTGDSKSGFTDAYKAFNMISAWAVGRAVDASYAPWVTGDRDFCNANGMDYQPCAYPGTAFYNTNGSSSPKNQFPRNHGDFLWAQFATFKNAGVPSAYIAMFDELNEATSIFKVAEDASMIPAGKYFLTLDADGTHVSSDFYLRLVNDGGKMLKGQIAYTTTEPTPFNGVIFYESNNYAGGMGQPLQVGNYTLSQLAAKGVPNDWASSVKVPPGRTVILYSDDNFSGTSWTITSDKSSLSSLSPSANDIISSVKVQ
ncbi:glycoside hydrolase family 71/99-like protein [Mucilaginibacter celer]|uniref:glycoside hydrolase family 71/99-like protein n=1 Tax=Mucilaginibacter celer TaxID=2305508 RepID=UPI001969082D|nr:glycoside hydrolase family 71/99-like protein [Mucilaginibacter celer]